MLPPVVLGIVVVVAWEAFINWQDVRPFVMPKPSAVWSEFTDNFSLVRDAMMVTGTNALIGLVVGTLIGMLLAAAANRRSGSSARSSPRWPWPSRRSRRWSSSRC